MPLTYKALSYKVLFGPVLALCLATVTATVTAQASGSDAAAANEQIIRQAFEDWAERGGAFARVLSPEISWQVHGSSPYSKTYTGIESFVNDASMPIISRLETPLKPDLKQVWSADDKVIVRFDAAALTVTGAPYQNQYLWILTMKDGLVTHSEAFLDMAAYDALVASAPPKSP